MTMTNDWTWTFATRVDLICEIRASIFNRALHSLPPSREREREREKEWTFVRERALHVRSFTSQSTTDHKGARSLALNGLDSSAMAKPLPYHRVLRFLVSLRFIQCPPG